MVRGRICLSDYMSISVCQYCDHFFSPHTPALPPLFLALANEAMDAHRSWTTGCESGDDDCTSSQPILDQGDQNNNNNNNNVDEGDQNDKFYV